MVVETWTDDEHTYRVVRVGFRSCAAEIMDAMRQLPSDAALWESLTYGETVEMVFRYSLTKQVAA